MKRLLISLLVLMAMCPAAVAEAAQRTTILAQNDYGSYIYRYIAPNGQELYFTAMEEDLVIHEEDVNFDGVKDIVINTFRGASNADYVFFLQMDGQYVRADDDAMIDRICNYSLHPEAGVVSTYNNTGSAGGEHEISLYRWDGADMICIRRAVSEHPSEYSHDRGIMTTTVDTNRLRMTVIDYEDDEDGDRLLWEATIVLEGNAFRDAYEQERQALWQGLK